jgi:hypothetical protein
MARSIHPVLILLPTLLLLSGRSIAAPQEIDTVVPADSSTTPDTRPSSDPMITHFEDLSIPPPTQFSWRLQGNYSAPTYDVYVSEDSLIDSADLVVSDLAEITISVWNLKIGTRYNWQIAVKNNKTEVRKTRIFSFYTFADWPRMIYIDGTTNVRDIGGRRNAKGQMIRQGLFYRSAEFNQYHIITPLGISQILALGIKCEIDLRHDNEGAMAVLPPSIHYFRPQSDVGGLYPYQYGLQYNGDQYRDVFREIAKPANIPIISHCMAGADREGTVAALLEALLDCTEKQMAMDYILTSFSVFGVRDSASTSWRDLISEIKSYDPVYGSVHTGACNYFLAKGLTEKEIIEIQNIFLPEKIPIPPDTQPSIPPSAPVPLFHNTFKYLSFSHPSSITIKQNVERLELYDLLGKKIWDFVNNNLGTEYSVHLSGHAKGIGILKSYYR